MSALVRRSTSILDPTKYHDKYVILYDFSDAEGDAATAEFQEMMRVLDDVGFDTEVRPGYGQSLLVFVKAPPKLLGRAVHKSRVKDWLYGIIPDHPGDDTSARGAFEAEDLLSVYHLVHWPKELGGAGIAPETGKWNNVKAIFPLQNIGSNHALLKHLSKRFYLTDDDFDHIRDLLGPKVAFYFAFIQTYILFLIVPATTGTIAWLWLPQYSLAYGILTSIWCAVFLEYWKIKEVDLSLRWKVKDVHKVKTNRTQFQYERMYEDEGGRKHYHFPKWKLIARQLVQIPFLLVAMAALSTAIVSVFAIEILISETYTGPYKYYLEYLPTILLAVSLPYITSFLEEAAKWITSYENHRTADYHEMSLTQKIFVLNMCTNYLPIFLTAFIYVPFGDIVVPRLEQVLQSVLGSFGQQFTHTTFRVDSDRLRAEVIALTVTGQLSSFFEENILPLVKHKFSTWYRKYREAFSKEATLLAIMPDDPNEAEFLARARNEGTLPSYNVQEDISEIVLQFGYLALFAPVWPVIGMGFLINNWVELRSDFAKISIEHQRPAPVRADGIGPWIHSLDALTWLGSISTASIVHLFSAEKLGPNSWVTLPVTIFISEHVLLLLRVFVRAIIHRIGLKSIREDRNRRYANRVKYLEAMEENKRHSMSLNLSLKAEDRQRRKSVMVIENNLFWTKQVEDGLSEAVGTKLIRHAKASSVSSVSSAKMGEKGAKVA